MRNSMIVVAVSLVIGMVMQRCTPPPSFDTNDPRVSIQSPSYNEVFQVATGEFLIPEEVDIEVEAEDSDSDDSGMNIIEIHIYDGSGNLVFEEDVTASTSPYPPELTYEGVFSTAIPGTYTLEATAVDGEGNEHFRSRDFTYE